MPDNNSSIQFDPAKDGIIPISRKELVDPAKYNPIQSNQQFYSNTPEFVGVGNMFPSDSMFDKGIQESDLPDVNKYRAEHQPWYAQASGAIGQAANEAVFGTIQSLAAIGDVESYKALLNDSSKSDEDFHNSVYNWAKGIKDSINEEIPIYSGDRFDSGWFWKNLGQTIGSAASFYVPGIGVAKGIGALGKAVKLGTTASGVLETLGGAAVMRHAENFMEASNIYEVTYKSAFDKFIKDGLDPQQASNKASSIAGEAAAHDYKLNSVNYAFDVLQLGAILKPKLPGIFKSFERQPYAVLKEANLLPESKLGKAVSWAVDPAKGILEAGSEGLEEVVNQVSQYESQRLGDIRSKKIQDDGSGFFDRLPKYLGEADTVDSFIWGAVGGAAFKGLGLLTGQDENKQITKNKLAELAGRNETLKSYTEQVNNINASNLSDVEKQSTIENLNKDLAFNLGLNASRVGNTDILLKQLDQQDFQEQLINSGIATKDEIEAKLPEIIKQVELADYLYNKYNNRFFESPIESTVKDKLINQSISLEKQLDDNNEEINKLKKIHNDIRLKDPVIKSNSLNPEFNSSLNLAAIKMAKASVQSQIDGIKKDNQTKTDLQSVLNKLDQKESKLAGIEFDANTFSNLELINNLAQQELLTEANNIINDKINNIPSKENIKKAEEEVSNNKKQAKEFVQENKVNSEFKAKQQRVNNTDQKLRLKQIRDVANKIVNRKSPDEQLTPEEQQVYDNYTEAVEQTIADIHNLRAEEAAQQGVQENPEFIGNEQTNSVNNPFGDIFEPTQNEIKEHTTETNTGYTDPNYYDDKKDTEVKKSVDKINENLKNDQGSKTTDVDGNIVIEGNKISEGYQALGYLSRLYELLKTPEGKKLYQDISDDLINSMDKIILSPDKFQPEDKVELFVDENYEGDIYDPAIKDDNKAIVSWKSYLDSLKNKYGKNYKSSDEYIENVPIAVKYNGEVLKSTYYHQNSWINENKVTGDIEQDRNNNKLVRKYIIDNGNLNTEIVSKGNGVLFRIKEHKPLSETIEDPNPILAVVNLDQTFRLAKGAAESSFFQDQTINVKELNPGTTVLLAEVNKGKYLALPVNNQKISKSKYATQVKESITQAIEAYLNNKKDDKFVLDVLKTMKLDITSIEGLESYITRFINNFNTNKQDLQKLQQSGTLPVNTNTTIFNINKGNIAFKHAGTVYYIGKNLQKQRELFFKNLDKALDNIYLGTNIEALSSNENLQFANGELISYKTFLRETLTSDFKGFKVDEVNGKPVYSYTIQKVVRLDFNNIIEENKPPIDEQSIVDTSSDKKEESVSFEKSSEPEFFKIFDLDQFSELPALSDEQESKLREASERLIVPGLDANKQEALVNTLVDSVLNKVFNDEKVNTTEVYNGWKDKLQKYSDDVKLWLDVDSNKSNPKYSNAERLYNSLQAILNGWSTITKFANQKYANINNLKTTYDSTLDEQEIEDSERFDFDKNIIEKDPMQGLSAQVKIILSGIQDIDKEGNPKKNWLGEPEMVDYKVVYTTFQQWTTDLLRPDFDDMLTSIKSHDGEFNWVPNAITKLESIKPEDRKAFVTDLLNHYKRLIKVMFDEKTEKGGFVNNLQSPSKISAADTLKDKWQANFINSSLVDLYEGDYIFNVTKCSEVVSQFKELQDKQDINTNDLKQWLANFNIELPERAWNKITKGQYRITGGKKLTVKDLVKNSYSPFVVLNNSINNLAKNRTTEDVDLFGNSAVKGLINFTSRNIENLYSQMVRTAGKSVYPFNKNTFVSNRILDLTKGELIEKLKTLPFNSASYWLSDKISPIFKANLELAVADMEVLKKHGDRRTGDNELQNLPESDYEMVKLGLLHASQEDKTGNNKRIISLLYPTQSDKTTSVIASGIPAFEIGYNIDGNIDEDTLNRVYDQLILPEINRIKHFQKLVDAGKTINISGLAKGWNKFYFLPSMNTLEGVFVDGRLNPDIQADEVINERIKTKLKNTINQLVSEKVNKWYNYGLIVEGKPKYIDNRFIKEKIKGIQKENYEALNKALATDTVLQYLVGNANMFMTMIYDPANAYKAKSKDPIEQMKETFNNIGKRLAADIAPGTETEANKSGTYKQAFVADRAIDSLNYDQLKDLLGEELAKDYTKKGLLEEGTNAQEFVTVSEQIARYYHEGKLPEDFYQTVIDTIKNEVLKDNHYYTDKVVEALNKVNPEYGNIFTDKVLQVEKPVHVGNQIDPELQHEVRYYVKTSAYTLTPELTANHDIDNIRIAMEKQGIDRLAFSSGIKLGNFTNPTKLWNEDGSIKPVDQINFSNSSVILNRSGFRIQQLVPYEPKKGTINRVSQASKNLFLNLHQVEGFEYRGEKYKGEDLEKIYQDLYKQIFDIQKNEFAQEIGYDLQNNRFVNTEESVKKIKKLLLEEAISRDYPISDIESLQLDDTLKFLAFSPSSQKFESLLNSLVQNRVLKIVFPGKSFVLSTEEGYQQKQVTQDEVKQKSDIVYTSNWKGQLLPQRIENGVVKPAQAIVPFKFRDNQGNLLHVEDFINKDGLIDINKLPQEILQLFGMRIPNQGLNSQSWIEIVGFMPHSAGDVIVATRDYLVQMGSDFDVDKLYTYMYSTYYDSKSGKLKRFKARPKEKQNVFEEDSISPENKKKELLNNILDVHIAIHSNPANEVQKQIFEPLGTWEFENIADRISKSETNNTDFIGISDQYQQDTKLNNATDKTLVGIYSNLSMFNAVAQNKGLKFQEFSLRFGNKVSNGDLSGEYCIGDKKTYRSTVISGLQSCAVDGAKLQVLGKFNHNLFTSKYVNLLAQLGFKEETALFTAQTVIKEIIKEVKDSKSILKPFESDVLNKTIIKFKDRIKQNIQNFDKELYNNKYADGLGLSIENMWSSIEQGEKNSEYNYIQLAAVEQLEKILSPSNTLSAVMSAINTDSKGLDKNLLETINKYDNVLKSVKSGNTAIENVEKLLQDNINGSATDILQMNNNIWNNILPYQNKGVQKYFNYILDIIGKQDASITKKAELQKEIFDEFKSYLYTRTELGFSDSDVYSERRRLFFDNTNLAQLISKLQEEEKWKNHPFIGKLYYEINKNGLPNVVKINAAQEDVIEQSTIMGAYDLLINDKPLSVNIPDKKVETSDNKEQVINIYSTLKNGYEKLSNLLNGPITTTIDGKEVTFKTVEHLFQVKKALFANDRATANAILSSKTGWDAQKLGRTVKDLNSKEWDKISSQELESSMRLAFEQNPEVKELLLKTGNATLVHKANVNLGKWETEFPRILTKLRSEFQNQSEVHTEKTNFTFNELINYSGAAQGSDTIWEQIGKEFGVGKQVNFTPNSLKSLKPDNFQEIENAYQKAVQILGRRVLDKNTYAGGLVRRDYLQAKAADTVFAIVEGFDNKNGKFLPKGGTGYAVVMADQLGKPVYIFSQADNNWYIYKNGNLTKTSTPILTKKYAGIGTRQINDLGKQAIRSVYEKTKSVITANSELPSQSYTTRQLMQDLILAAYISGGIQQATQYLKYIPPAYLHTIPFAEKLTQMIDKFNDDEFMQIPGENSYNWELPSFIVQYFQHNTDRVKKISTDKNGNLVGIQRLETKDKVVEKFAYTNLIQGEPIPTFLTIKSDKKRSKGLSKNYIYIHQGEELNGNSVYTRIDNLGYSGFNEYNANLSREQFAKSLITENNANNTLLSKQPENENKEVSRKLVDPELTKFAFDKLEVKQGGVESIDNILENIIFEDSIDPYYRTVASVLRTNLDNYKGLKITTKDIKGKGYYDNIDTLNINPERVKGLSLNELSKVILHELIHTQINPHLDNFSKGKIKGYTKEQLIALTRVKKVWENYVNIIENTEGEKYKKFLEAYNKYLAEKEVNTSATLSATPKEVSKYYPVTDLREFVTMALTDNTFQKVLNEVPFNDNQSWLEKIFNELTNLLSKMLGIEVKKGSSLEVALHDVMSLLENNTYNENINTTTEKLQESELPSLSQENSVSLWERMKYVSDQEVQNRIKACK